MTQHQGEQFGFINLYNMDAGDPEAEQRIVRKVGSYGRQLGWVVEALKVLVDDRLRGEQPALSDEELKPLRRLLVLAEDIEGAK